VHRSGFRGHRDGGEIYVGLHISIAGRANMRIRRRGERVVRPNGVVIAVSGATSASLGADNPPMGAMGQLVLSEAG
jgi:hypothetical protein